MSRFLLVYFVFAQEKKDRKIMSSAAVLAGPLRLASVSLDVSTHDAIRRSGSAVIETTVLPLKTFQSVTKAKSDGAPVKVRRSDSTAAFAVADETQQNTATNNIDTKFGLAVDDCEKDVERCRDAILAAGTNENTNALIAAVNRLNDAQHAKSAAEVAALTLGKAVTSARLAAAAAATVPAATLLIVTSVTVLAGADQAFQRLFDVTGVGSMSQAKAVCRYRAALSAGEPALVAAIMSSPVEILQYQAVCAALTTIAFTFWVSEQAY